MSNRKIPVLTIEELSVAFQNGNTESIVVDSVNLELFKGKTTALVGESGSGKSVTAHSILKLLPYPKASHPSGKIFYNKKDLLQLEDNELRNIRGSKISMIFQEPMTALNPLHTVEKQISEVLMKDPDCKRSEIHERVVNLLQQVQIQEPQQKLKAHPHQLSGGQRQRVMIAMALANDPDILIADEPTTALDVTVQREILDLLKALQKQRGLSILLITHDLSIVRYFSDYVSVMHEGTIIETGTVNHIFKRARKPYTKSLINSDPQGEPITVSEDSPTSISTKDLTVAYPLQKNWFGKAIRFFYPLKKASLEVPQGTTLGIVGESGSGKSTLAQAILRLIPSTGEIKINEFSVNDLPSRSLRPFRRHIQIVFQDPFSSLSPRMTVSEIIAEGLLVHGEIKKKEIEERVVNVMTEVGLNPDHRHRYPHEFSGGQRQRISIARALILNPQVVILDEPTSALDRSVQLQVINLLRDLQKDRGLTYLFISHDFEVIRAISHNIIVMRHGEILESGPTKTILESPNDDYTRTLITNSFLAEQETPESVDV